MGSVALSALPASSLWFIAGRAYDLRPWIEQHPGGREALELARGTNCTELFRSYHLLRGPSNARLARYEVDVDRGDPEMVELLEGAAFTFAEDGFYKTLSRRVKAHMREEQKDTVASPGWQAVAAASVLIAIGLAVPAYVFGSVLAAVVMGFVRAMASIGPGHSMSHFSQFPRGNWNSLLFRLGSPFLVSTWSIWTNTHVRSHHVDTLTGEDLQDQYPLKRVQPTAPHRGWHRGQHLYMWAIYLLALPLWALQDLVASLISLFTDRYMSRRYTFARRLENTFAIAFNLLFAVAMPFFFLDWKSALLVCLLSNMISSLLVVVQIVINHEVPETMSRVVAGEPIDWGAHQVLTSHNYGVGSRLALHLSGGLNMQVEHHLFPGVHYTHYPALSPIVQRTCAEFGLPYFTSTHVWQAIGKHHRLLAHNRLPG